MVRASWKGEVNVYGELGEVVVRPDLLSAAAAAAGGEEEGAGAPKMSDSEKRGK